MPQGLRQQYQNWPRAVQIYAGASNIARDSGDGSADHGSRLDLGGNCSLESVKAIEFVVQ